MQFNNGITLWHNGAACAMSTNIVRLISLHNEFLLLLTPFYHSRSIILGCQDVVILQHMQEASATDARLARYVPLVLFQREAEQRHSGRTEPSG